MMLKKQYEYTKKLYDDRNKNDDIRVDYEKEYNYIKKFYENTQKQYDDITKLLDDVHDKNEDIQKKYEDVKNGWRISREFLMIRKIRCYFGRWILY